VLLTAAVTALAAALRLHALGRESLWLDEGFTWQRARLPVRELIANAIGAHHNPSYFLAMHYWMQLGDDEWMLRFPSAFAGSVAAGATTLFGYVLGGPAAGLVAGVLLAVSPLQVHFGQEARMYAPLCASATIAAAAVFWFGMNPEAAARPIAGTERLHARLFKPPPQVEPNAGPQPSSARAPHAVWAAYVLGMIASLYLHNTAVIFAATLGIGVLVLLARPLPLRLRFSVNFVAANLVVLLVWAAYLHTELRQAERFADSQFWAVFPTCKDLFGYLREIYVLTARVPSALSVLLLIAAVLGAFALRKRPEVAAALVCFAALGPALMLFVSLYKPIFGTRFLLWVSPPFFALVGVGVAQRRPYLFALSFLVAVCVLVEPQLRRDYTDLTNEPWREVVSSIHARGVTNGRILTATFEEATMFDYYMHRSCYPFPEIPVAIKRRRQAWKQAGAHVWLVDRKAGRRSKRVRRDLTQRGTIVWEHTWNERLRVTEFDLTRRPPQSSASLN
jgi:mannosyltransferase